jgi:hypothetical protein
MFARAKGRADTEEIIQLKRTTAPSEMIDLPIVRIVLD